MPISGPIMATVIGQTWVMSFPLKSGSVNPIERADSERRGEWFFKLKLGLPPPPLQKLLKIPGG